jgi:4-diphosphocytidyl-2-C-methyl-D-erythritol kinase
MSTAISLFCPAKLNLHLDIGALRQDGYHELRSLFQMISLGDEMLLSGGEPDGECVVEGDFGARPEENIITAAYRLYCERTGLREGIRVQVNKQIPEGAGLGGGSSNAAAALRLLDAYFKNGLPAEELLQMGAQLGSDVPFFMGPAAALVSGRGEQVEAVPPRTEWELLVVQPDFAVSTGAAYRWLDERRSGSLGASAVSGESGGSGAPQASAVPDTSGASGVQAVEEGSLSAEELKRRYAALSPAQWGFFNSFSPVLGERFPFYERFFSRCNATQALYANISGSGSAAFALFPGETSRDACYLSLREEIKKGWKVKMLASSPMPVYN